MKFKDWVEAGKPIQPFAPYNRSAGAIVDVQTGEQFASASPCAKSVGLSDVAILKQARGETKSRRFVFLDEWVESGGEIRTHDNPRAVKEVVRVDSGEIFATTSAAAAASIEGTVGGLSLALKQGKPYRGVAFRYVTAEDSSATVG